MSLSLIEKIALLPRDERNRIIQEIAPTNTDKLELQYNWKFNGRPEQIAPASNWTYWLLLAGRGFGKTKSIAQWAKSKAIQIPNSRGAIIASTAADARDVIVEGESGILAISSPRFMPIYEPSKRRLTWPNGSIATIYTADKPDRLRGPQHHWAICDELGSWRYAQTAWDMLMFGLRLGTNPQCVIATTPRPIPLLKNILRYDDIVITRGTTYDNQQNLAPSFVKNVIKRYEGTRLGRQELNGELLGDTLGALWTYELLDALRLDIHPPLVKIVVAIDPAVTSNKSSDETGLVVAGIDTNGHGYILEDATDRYTPNQWGEKAIELADRWSANYIVGETNNGGDLIKLVVDSAAKKLYDDKKRRTPNIVFKDVRASKGKFARAEPISMLYEQGRVHHIGVFPGLEDEMCTYTKDQIGNSPDRLDALTWSLTSLMLDNQYSQSETEW